MTGIKRIKRREGIYLYLLNLNSILPCCAAPRLYAQSELFPEIALQFHLAGRHVMMECTGCTCLCECCETDLCRYYSETDRSSWVWIQQTQGLIITCLCLMFPCCHNCCHFIVLSSSCCFPHIPSLWSQAMLLSNQAEVTFALKCNSWLSPLCWFLAAVCTQHNQLYTQGITQGGQLYWTSFDSCFACQSIIIFKTWRFILGVEEWFAADK